MRHHVGILVDLYQQRAVACWSQIQVGCYRCSSIRLLAIHYRALLGGNRRNVLVSL